MAPCKKSLLDRLILSSSPWMRLRCSLALARMPDKPSFNSRSHDMVRCPFDQNHVGWKYSQFSSIQRSCSGVGTTSGIRPRMRSSSSVRIDILDNSAESVCPKRIPAVRSWNLLEHSLIISIRSRKVALSSMINSFAFSRCVRFIYRLRDAKDMLVS